VIAFDTNILVYAHRPDSPFHERASEIVRAAAEGREPWALLWPCLHEFISIVTHARIFRQPTPIVDATRQIEAWLAAPAVVVLGELDGYWEVLSKIAKAGKVTGPKIHDARIAALATFHAVDELWSADRDFNRFPTLRIRNPLID
jgi:uncharacterized protein